MIEFKKLDWDSELFGYPVVSYTGSILDQSDLSYSLEELRKEGTKLVYITVKKDDGNSNELVLRCGGTIVDEKVHYTRKLTSQDTFSDDNIVSYLGRGVTDQILALALESGEFSRFHTDPHFTHDEYKKLYTAWLMKSLTGEIAEDILIYLVNDREAGFVTWSEKESDGSIGLLVVDAKKRGKNIGKKLMAQAFSDMFEKGLLEATVATQRKNTVACIFYEKIGFIIEKEENIYHFWL